MENSPPRKQLILREAAKLFREIGFVASNLRELAKRCGIKGGSLYYYFSSKQEILYTIMDFTMTELIDTVMAEVKKQPDPVEKLRVAIKRHIDFHLEYLNETYVTDNELRSLTEENHLAIVAKRDAYELAFRHIINEGIEKGIFDTENAKIITIGILQMCTGTSSWFRRDGQLTSEMIGDIYFNFTLNAILKERK